MGVRDFLKSNGRVEEAFAFLIQFEAKTARLGATTRPKQVWV